eukprot:138735_1
MSKFYTEFVKYVNAILLEIVNKHSLDDSMQLLLQQLLNQRRQFPNICSRGQVKFGKSMSIYFPKISLLTKRMLKKYKNCGLCKDASVLIAAWIFGKHWFPLIGLLENDLMSDKYKMMTWILNNEIYACGLFEQLSLYPYSLHVQYKIIPAGFTIVLIENLNKNFEWKTQAVEFLFFTHLVPSFIGGTSHTAIVGALMFFGQKYISALIQNMDPKVFVHKVQQNIDNVNRGLQQSSQSLPTWCNYKLLFMSVTAKDIYAKIKPWINRIQEYGSKCIMQLYTSLTLNDGELMGLDSSAYFIIAKFFFVNKKYEKAEIYWIITACSADSYYIRIIALIYLSEVCYRLNEFMMALKSLRIAYKLCHYGDDTSLILLPTFVRYEYESQKKILKTRLNSFMCEYKFCGKIYKKVRLRACSGCIKVMYCCKSHQKKDWKLRHSKQCNRKWKENYKTIKSGIFDQC